MANEQNLIPWRPGQSGNTKGRPKRPIGSALEALMTPELARVMAHTLAAMAVGDKKALKGRKPEIAWMKELLERTEGKVTDTLEVTDAATRNEAEEFDAKCELLYGDAPAGDGD